MNVNENHFFLLKPLVVILCLNNPSIFSGPDKYNIFMIIQECFMFFKFLSTQNKDHFFIQLSHVNMRDFLTYLILSFLMIYFIFKELKMRRSLVKLLGLVTKILKLDGQDGRAIIPTCQTQVQIIILVPI